MELLVYVALGDWAKSPLVPGWVLISPNFVDGYRHPHITPAELSLILNSAHVRLFYDRWRAGPLPGTALGTWTKQWTKH